MVSKIGKLPIAKSGATFETSGNVVSVGGPKGQLKVVIPGTVGVKVEGEQIFVSLGSHDPSSLHGLTRTLISNAVTGVTQGWTKTLELVGTGYRAALEGANLNLSLGFSHPVKISPPPGITFTVDQSKIIVSGADKNLVGQIAAKIRAIRPPEPYKGKGVKYIDEKVRRKAGKAAKAVGGTAK